MEILNTRDRPWAVARNQEVMLEYTGRLSEKIADEFSLTSFVGTEVMPEVVVVNRQIDKKLQSLIVQAATLHEENPDPINLAIKLASLVHERMENPHNSLSNEQITILDFVTHRPDTISGIHLLGDIALSNRRSGVCRHQALLFKILGDETDLGLTLRAGLHEDGNKGHMWNELIIGQDTYVLDTRDSRYNLFGIDHEFGKPPHIDSLYATWYKKYNRSLIAHSKSNY